ncbi:hypothetical protein [Tahibacter soli]|uniref:DUF2306 domain-containing protein n=1 Tax=Tahibacter soli TaxID=2983605 RepID=A0A9X3YKX8_9GAMM|nr:hypothetical protein [Tahibacter soli]MDC8013130.1 hypothetical protein [Tahibacter soli]
MLGITTFGLFHTAISLVSLFAGLYGLARYGEIRYANPGGRLYVLVTIVTCATGFFIVRHGGFSEAHALGIATLVVLAGAWFADRDAPDRGARRCIAALGYTLTVFFHFIPGFNETLTRIPVGAPFVSGPRDPVLLALVGATFGVFAVIGALQARRLLAKAAVGIS